jgi:hypothetical protein
MDILINWYIPVDILRFSHIISLDTNIYGERFEASVKMAWAFSSETLVYSQKTTRRDSPADHYLNLRSISSRILYRSIYTVTPAALSKGRCSAVIVIKYGGYNVAIRANDCTTHRTVADKFIWSSQTPAFTPGV